MKKTLSNFAPTNLAPPKKRIVTMACGHKVSVDSGDSKEKSDEIVRRRKDFVLCYECSIKAEPNHIEVAAIMGCRQARCAVLTGTEKQIMWAEVIRFAHLLALDEYRNDIEEIQKDDNSKRKAAIAVIGKTIKWLKSVTESKWWIENHADSYKSAFGYRRPWPTMRETVEIIGLAMKILIISPHMNSSAASALGMDDNWNDLVKEKAKAEAQAKALAVAIIADKELEPNLVARARALAWHGVIKPWWRDGENRLYFNEMDNCSICWMRDNFDSTVRFWRMEDSPESRQLAKDVWHWCVSEPNSNKARSLQV